MKLSEALSKAEDKKTPSLNVWLCRSSSRDETRFTFVEILQKVPENLTLFDLLAVDWELHYAVDQ